MNQPTERTRKIYRVTWIGMVVNIALSLLKLAAGILGRSGAMIADAVHSISDLATDVIVLIFARISSKPEDAGHNYGHGKYETLASILISLALIAVGGGILADSIHNIRLVLTGEIIGRPGAIALIAAAISIVAKEVLYRYTVRVGRQTDSPSVVANAWHHRSDALSSVGSFVGILGARMGFPILDPIASVLICLMIIKVSYDIVRDAIDKLVDKSCDDETIRRMQTVIMEQEGVMGVDLLKTRLFGAKIYVDVEICADGNQTLIKAHEIAENVHQALEHGFPDVKHCMVHVNPKQDEPDAAPKQQNKG